MKKLPYILTFLLFCSTTVLFCSTTAYSQGPLLLIEEEDGDPSVAAYKLKVPNTTLTNNNDGTASYVAAGATEVNNLETITTGIADDEIPVGTTTNTVVYKSVPDCDTAGTDKLLYDTTTNSFSCGVDQDSGGATAWDDIGDPDNDGLTTIDFDHASENILLTTAYDAAGSFFTINDSDADVANQMYLLDLNYSVDDDQVLADYFRCQDAGGTVFSIMQDGDTEIYGALAVGSNLHPTISVNGVTKSIQFGVYGDDVADTYISYMDRASDTHSSTVAIVRARGTHGSPTQVVDDDILGQIAFMGWDDTDNDLNIGAYIRAVINGVAGNNDLPTELIFATALDGEATPTARMSISNAGLINIVGLTASEIVITDASKNLTSGAVATYPSLAELIYLKGVTSAIQGQIDAKSPSTAPTFNGLVDINSDANETVLEVDNDHINHGLYIHQDGVLASTKHGIYLLSTVAQTNDILFEIDQFGGSTQRAAYIINRGVGDGLYINQLGILAASSYSFYVRSNVVQINSPLVFFEQDNASSTEPTLEIQHDGAGAALEIFADHASGSHMRFTGDTANGTPVDGDFWWNGTNLNFYNGAASTDLLAAADAETNDLETVATNAASNEIFVGTGANVGAYIGITACAANEKIEYTDAAPNTFTCETIALTDAEVSDTLTSSTCTGNAATVTNATLTTALTVNTGTLTLTAHADNDSVLTIGKGASSVSGANTGDNDEVGTLTTGDMCTNDGSAVQCTVNTEAELETAMDALNIMTVSADDFSSANFATACSDEDNTGACAADKVCMGGHTHPAYATLDSPTFTTAFTATGLIGDEDLQSEDFGEFTCAGEDACTIDDSVAVTSWNLTTPIITTSIDLPAGAINTATEIAADIITHTQIADADQTDTKCIWFEDPVATDDFNSIWANKTANDFLITEIWGESDQTVSFDLQVDDGSPADVSQTDIAPAAGEAEDISLDGDTTVAAGEELDLIITSVTNTPTWVSICFTGNWVD